MKKINIYLVLVINLFTIQVSFGQNFHEQCYCLDLDIRKQNLYISGEKVMSNNWHQGDEFTFNVRIIPQIKTTYNGYINTYIKVYFPNQMTKIYQLDYVRSTKTRRYISYSCILVLVQKGDYRIEYYAKNLNGKTFYDPRVYKFKVLSEQKGERNY